ncbi:cytochrome P450 [Streptomyces sp. NPDC056296]|uniref:cytochrome P450 n=1 Tax=Streptomyces sp. NPDC056296 TaxID=3345775 RepID=UPI0035DF22D4
MSNTTYRVEEAATHQGAAVSVDRFRPDDPEIQKDPYPYYPLLREQRPVYRTSFGDQPCWVLSRRRDIQKVLLDPGTFSSRTTPLPIMLFQDPPDHGRLRKMVAHMFTQAAVAPMEPAIERKAADLLDAARTKGLCDVITDFAAPLTMTTIGLILGISVDEVERLRQLTRLQQDYVLSIRLQREPSAESREANDALVAFMADLIRGRHYADNRVVAALADMLGRGELTEEECANFAVMLFIAGHSTTTNLIGNSVYMLSRRPGDLVRMREEEQFVAAFMEEVLRTRPSFHRNVRVTTRDAVIAGETIPAGSVVRLLLASANRDPEFFENPEVFDPDLERRTNLSFGRGIHVCLGSWLARLEAATALRVFSRGVASVALDSDSALVRLSGGTFNEFGFEHLPVRLTARDAEKDRT